MKESWNLLLFSSLLCPDVFKDSWMDFTPAQVDSLVESPVAKLCTTLDNVAPLRNRVISQRRQDSWFNSE